MLAQSAKRKTELRSGFTLLELMLVLAIMVLIASLVVPQLGEVFERQKLNGAAQNLRLAWDRARLDAMRSGQAQVFACTLGTNEYTLKPLVLASDAVNAGTGATVMAGAGSMIETQDAGYFTGTDASELTETEKLEEQITFRSCLVANDMRAYTVAQDAQTTGLGEVDTQSISQQVIFYPDGSASTAEVQVQNERGDVRAVRMRGITGHSRVVALLNVATDVDGKSSSKK